MLSLNQHSQNSDNQTDVFNSDSRTDKLQLLSYAIELYCREYITCECPSIQQTVIKKKFLLEDAAEALTTFGTNLSPDKQSMVMRALLRAYDIFSADMEKRDMSFFDCSYAELDTDQYNSLQRH